VWPNRERSKPARVRSWSGRPRWPSGVRSTERESSEIASTRSAKSPVRSKRHLSEDASWPNAEGSSGLPSGIHLSHPWNAPHRAIEFCIPIGSQRGRSMPIPWSIVPPSYSRCPDICSFAYMWNTNQLFHFPIREVPPCCSTYLSSIFHPPVPYDVTPRGVRGPCGPGYSIHVPQFSL
jgi:hypothetical protein